MCEAASSGIALVFMAKTVPFLWFSNTPTQLGPWTLQLEAPQASWTYLILS